MCTSILHLKSERDTQFDPTSTLLWLIILIFGYCCACTSLFPRWFCDTTLRRLAKTLVLGPSPATTQPSEEDEPDPTMPAADGTSGWGAASAPAPRTLVLRDNAGSKTPGVRVVAPGGVRAYGGATRPNISGSPHRFRTFTVICARTAVTEKGARVAEALSPGLLVVLEDQPAACYV